MDTFKLENQDTVNAIRTQNSPEKGEAGKAIEGSSALSASALNLAQKSVSFSNVQTNSHCEAAQPNSGQTMPTSSTCGVSAFSVAENGHAPREDPNGVAGVTPDKKNTEHSEQNKQTPPPPQCPSGQLPECAYMAQAPEQVTLPKVEMVAQLEQELKQPNAHENQNQLPDPVNFVPNYQQAQPALALAQQEQQQESVAIQQKMPPISSILSHTAAFQQKLTQDCENISLPGLVPPAYKDDMQQMLERRQQQQLDQMQQANRNLYAAGSSDEFGFDLINLRQKIPFDATKCQHCKEPDDLRVICCECEHPYHLRCVGLQKTPHDQYWYCQDCQQVRRANLLKKLKEENRRKAEERQKKKDEENRVKEEARKLREEKMSQRREEKVQMKAKLQEQRIERENFKHAQLIAKKIAIEEAALKKQEALEKAREVAIAQGLDPDALLKFDGSHKRSVQTTLQMAMENGDAAVNHGFNDPTLLLAMKAQRITEQKKKIVKKIPPQLSEEEIKRQERQKLIKNQMQVFWRHFPELVEKNSIRYPIEDSLILKLPELHGIVYPEKPQPKVISTSNEEFERLLYIWEFCNNFDEFLNTPKFRMEDLRLALRWGSHPSIDDEDEFSTQIAVDDFRDEQETLIAAGDCNWTEQMTDKQLSELGFNMVNVLHLALLGCFMQDMFQEEEGEAKTNQPSFPVDESSAAILAAINKLISEKEKEQIWPEIVRLVLLMKHEVEDFGELESTMTIILKKLVGLEPASFSSTFTYNEKLTLLTVLIDSIHDLNHFRSFLNQRQETKTQFNKEKQDVYSAIKLLEAEQTEILKEMMEPDFIEEQDKLQRELDTLKEQMMLNAASRNEMKNIRARVTEINHQQERAYSRKSTIEDKIARNQIKVQRLADKAYQTAIKTTMLGRDAQRQEYWHFKDDPARIYIRREEQIPVLQKTVKSMNSEENNQAFSGESPSSPEIQNLPSGMEEEIASEVKISWFYYDTDVEVDTLLNLCLNPKGIRERALQATMRSVRDRLKLKKGTKEKEVVPIQADDKEKSADPSLKPLEEKVAEENSDEMAEEVKADVVMSDAEPEKEKEEEEELKDEEELICDQEMANETDQAHRSVALQVDLHIMFKTDKWDQSFQNAVWFGKKTPPKRRAGMRVGGRNQPDKEMTEFAGGPELVSLAHAKKLLFNTETFYTDSSTRFSREWAKDETRGDWKASVGIVESCCDLSDLLTKLDDGMSLPNMLAKEGPQRGGSQYFRLMHFKFWPNQELRRAWRDYLGEPLKSSDADEPEDEAKSAAKEDVMHGYPKDGNQNALFILLKILERITEQFVVREVEKQEKKERQQALQAVGGAKLHEPKPSSIRRVPHISAPQVSRDQRKQASFAKYFESSNEEDDEYDNEEEQSEEEREEEVKEQTQQKARAISDEDVSSSEVEQQESEEEESQSREWDEYCMICEDGGNVICCDKCNHVAHVACLNLRKMPDDWLCDDCTCKQAKKAPVQSKLTTNGRLAKQSNKPDKKEQKKKNTGKQEVVLPSRQTRRQQQLQEPEEQNHGANRTSRSSRAARRKGYYS